jgi:Bacterial protein of unknown function (DUF922)
MNPANFNKTIAWTDFTEKTVSPIKNRSAFTQAKWPFSFDFDKNVDGKYTAKNVKVTVGMDTVKSWVVKDDKSDSLLNHEQGHYNITALGARDFLNGVLDLEADSSKELQKAINDLQSSTQATINSVNSIYDDDPNCGTDHGSKSDKQSQWDLRIKNAMNDPKGTLDSLASCPAAAAATSP